MLALGEHCSQTERRADEATRDAVDWLKCEFMMNKVGEVFEGTITSVTGFGLFVELDNIYVEGLIHVTSLDKDYYHFDANHHRLVGERSGQVFRLGDHIVVSVANVNLDDKKIDFDLVAASRETRKGKAAAGKEGKSRHQGRDRSARADADPDTTSKGKKKTSKKKKEGKKKLNKKAKKRLAEKKKLAKKKTKKHK
jgi:ribonuclease R